MDGHSYKSSNDFNKGEQIMITILETVFIGLVIMIPTIFALILQTKLNITKYKLDYYRQQCLYMNHRFLRQEDK